MTNYITTLRNLSTFAVILLHVVAIYVGNYKNISLTDWQIVNFIDSLLRFCVPVFLMISGALLLQKEESISSFISKRLKRVAIPFICWNIIYFFYKSYSTNLSIPQVITNLANSFTKGASYHFWYVYLIVGIYLFIPILRRWTSTATKKELQYFLVIWFLTLCISGYNLSYLPQIELMYFSKYIGYLIIGHYIHQYVSSNNARIWSLLLFISGVVLTYYLTLNISVAKNRFIDTYYSYLSPNVALSAIGLFTFIKTLDVKMPASISKTMDLTSYGVFLVHIIVLTELKTFINVSFQASTWSILGTIVLLSLSTYLISFFIIYILSRIPYLKKIML